MNFDQLGRQHVSRRRKPSPLRNIRRSPASFDANFSQHVWKRPRNTQDIPENDGKREKISFGRGRRRSGFSIPVSWLKNIAVVTGILVIGIVGPNWDSISRSFRSPEITVKSLEDTSSPLVHNEAGFGNLVSLDFSRAETGDDTGYLFGEIPLNLTKTFSWSEYTVRQGDTISGIASRYGVSMESIIAFNGLKEAWNLRIGRKLRIPNMDGIPYTVQKNDTLSRIAEKMKTPQNAILDANNLASDTIRSGEVLFIPGGRMDASEFRRAIRRDAPVQNAVEKLMIYPVSGRLTSGYGWRLDPVKPESGIRRFHHAIDLISNTGDPVKAAMKGTVLNVDHNPNLGNFVILGHGEYQTLYAHLSAFSVRTGDAVDQGQEIGKVGNTGYTTNPHLHFEVFRKGNRINPLEVLK